MSIRRFLPLLYFYAVLFCSSIIIQSCCTEGPGQIIGPQNFTVYDADNGGDTLRSRFVLYGYFDVEIAQSTQTFSPYASAYAVSCEPGFVNSIDQTTLSITMDQPFNFDGRPLAPGYNILELDTILTTNFLESDFEIFFDYDFIEKSKFETGLHDFYLYCRTDDGIEIRDTVTAYFDIQ